MWISQNLNFLQFNTEQELRNIQHFEIGDFISRLEPCATIIVALESEAYQAGAVAWRLIGRGRELSIHLKRSRLRSFYQHWRDLSGWRCGLPYYWMRMRAEYPPRSRF